MEDAKLFETASPRPEPVRFGVFFVEKMFKNFGGYGGINAGPVIANRNRIRTRPTFRNGDSHLTNFLGCLNRIQQQIRHNLSAIHF